jgi:hypothetical protein
MLLPNPPVVVFDTDRRTIYVRFDSDYEFAHGAAVCINEQLSEAFPVMSFMDSKTKLRMEAFAANLQEEALQRGEMILVADPVELGATEKLLRLEDPCGLIREKEGERTVEEIRRDIDSTIEDLWAKGIRDCQVGNPGWSGYALIEGLKRARALTGEPWVLRGLPGAAPKHAEALMRTLGIPKDIGHKVNITTNPDVGVLVAEHEWPPFIDIVARLRQVQGFTSIQVDLEPGFRAYELDAPIPISQIVDVNGKAVFPGIMGVGALYFVDQFPDANWVHRCTYIVVLLPGGDHE